MPEPPRGAPAGGWPAPAPPPPGGRRPEIRRLPPPAVDRIAHDGMPDVLEVDPDLVGAAGVQLEPEQVRHAEPAPRRRRRSGRRGPPGDHGHALPVLRVPGERGLDHRRALVEVAPGQRGVGAADPPRRDRGAQPPVGQVGLGHDHEARRCRGRAGARCPAGPRRRPTASFPGPPARSPACRPSGPAPGCTTSPAGLSMTARCSSSKTTVSGMRRGWRVRGGS